MGRPQVIAAYRKAAELARQHGCTVEFAPGWTSRGRDGFTPTIIVEHDTSDPARLTHARMLAILTDGHGALAGNAICNDAILDDGRIVIIASGLAWHAGAGIWDGQSGNARALGTEYQRAATGALTARQLEVGRIWTRARTVAFGLPTRRVCDHAEYATPRGRKVDRSLRPGVRLDGADWRRSLTATVPPPEDDVMTPAQEAKLDRLIERGDRNAAAIQRLEAELADVKAGRIGGRSNIGADLRFLRLDARAIGRKLGLPIGVEKRQADPTYRPREGHDITS